MVDVVLHTLLPRADAAQLTVGVFPVGAEIEVPGLTGRLGRRGDQEEPLGAGHTDPDPVVLVLLPEDADVLTDRAADMVTPHLVGTPGLIHPLVEEIVVADPRRSGGDTGDLVVQQLTGGEVLDPQIVTLVAGQVDGICEVTAVEGHTRRTEAEELVALGQVIAVEDDLLVRRGFPRHDLRRGPRGGVIDGDTAGDAVALALLGAGEVPVAPGADRQGHVSLADTLLHLAEDGVLERLEVGSTGVGEGVLRLQVRPDSRIVLLPEPFVVVPELAAVEGAGVRDLRGDRGKSRHGRGHRSV